MNILSRKQFWFVFLKTIMIIFADIVLELDEENDKALYRKAQALKLLRDFSGAQETFEKLKGVPAKIIYDIFWYILPFLGLDNFLFFHCFSGARKKEFQS